MNRRHTLMLAMTLAISLPPAAARAMTAVPDVVGMKGADAKKKLDALKIYAVLEEDLVTTDDKKVGTVASQSKRPGSLELVPTTITLHVYKKGTGVTVPNLSGKNVDEVKKALFALGLGLEYGTDVRGADPALAGKVASQLPPAGGQVAKGASVKVAFYLQVAKASVPNVVGQADDPACRALSAAGFPYKHETSTGSDPATYGKVVKQEPAAGASVAAGTQVTIWIGKAGDKVSIPNVVGMTIGEASAALTKASLTPGLSSAKVMTTTASKVDRVAEQSPAANQSVAAKSRVEYKVYVLDTVKVPKVVMARKADAIADLQKAGLVADVRSQTTLGGGLCRVTVQSPTDGTLAVRGSKVTITVTPGCQ